MIRYIPIASQDELEKLNAALWSLARPSSERESGKDTRYMFGAVSMNDGSLWLEVDDAYAFKVHDKAGKDSLTEIMAPMEAKGDLPAGEIDKLAARIEAARSSAKPWTMLPKRFRDIAKTRAQLISLKLFPQITPP